jgi:hypothetical protein
LVDSVHRHHHRSLNVTDGGGAGAQAYAGLCPDGRQIINRARGEASQYKAFYGDAIPGQTLCDRIASYVHLFTLYWYVRPYGVGTLLAVYDKTGPQLYHVEPSGIAYVRSWPLPPRALWSVSDSKTPSSGTRTTQVEESFLETRSRQTRAELRAARNRARASASHVAERSGCRGRVVWVSQRYFGTAVGKGRQAAKTEIERLKLEEMTAREAVKQVAKMCVQRPRCQRECRVVQRIADPPVLVRRERLALADGRAW